MDLPIVMRKPVTAADRWRWFALAVLGGLATYAVWLAPTFLRAHPLNVLASVPFRWIEGGDDFILAFICIAPFFGAIGLIFAVDQTWIIDENTLTIRSVFLIGRRTQSWPLQAITGVRIRKIEGEGGPDFRVQIRLAGKRWIGIRSYVDEDQAQAFSRLLESVRDEIAKR